MGSNPIVQGALVKCSFGSVPMPVTVTSQPLVKMGGMTAATMMDNKPFMFGTCSSPMHPVMASTGAPGPCLAAAQISAPWIGSKTVRICGKCAVNKDSKLICNFGGQIALQFSPAITVKIGS